MATRTRRRRRARSQASIWRKLLLAAAIVALLFAIAASFAASWAVNDLQLRAAALEPETGAEGPLLGDLRRRRQPDRLHPLEQHPPARFLPRLPPGPEERDGRDRGPRTSSTTERIDPAGIARAAWKDLLAGGKPVQGASTITQQLVRNLYIQNPEETIKRKLIEAHLANDEEAAHSKNWILTAYLNTAPYGTVEGQTAVGAEAAAQTYFGKPAKDLEPDRGGADRRAAAGALRIQPLPRPEGGAANAATRCSAAMEDQGYITRLEYREALHSGLGLRPGPQVPGDP